MTMAQEQLRNIGSFSCDGATSGVTAIPPYYEYVFTEIELQYVKCIYRQLYPQSTNMQVSPLYKKCGRVYLTGDLIGSEMPGANNIKSSVIS